TLVGLDTGQQLLDVERVALAARVQAVDELVAAPARRRGHLAPHLRAVDRSPRAARDQRAAAELGEQPADRILALELVEADGDDEREALAARALHGGGQKDKR